MSGDQQLGAMLRELREARNLTLAAVARQAGCAESLVSYVESGRRRLQPWLAERLDALYGTGGAIGELLSAPTGADAPGRGKRAHTVRARQPDGVPSSALDDVLLVRPPEGGITMPVSRHELLAGLGIGALGGALADRVNHLLGQLDLGDDPLAAFERTFAGFATAARSQPSGRLIEGMTGQVALLDGLRCRASTARRGAYALMQARYAESLSWLCEEAGNATGSLYWVDRTAQWAAAARMGPNGRLHLRPPLHADH